MATESIVYGGRVIQTEPQKYTTLNDVILDVDLIKFENNITLDVEHETRDTHTVSILVPSNLFKLGDYVTLKVIKDDNLQDRS